MQNLGSISAAHSSSGILPNVNSYIIYAKLTVAGKYH